MSATRLRKILKDFAVRPARSLLTLLGLGLGLFGVCTVLVALALLADDMRANYLQTTPPHIVAQVRNLDSAQLTVLGALPGVVALENRPDYLLRLQLSPGRWIGVQVFVVDDFRNLRVARFSAEEGAWPPPDDGILLEREARYFLDTPLQSDLQLRLPDGRVQAVPLSGYAYDPGLPPSRMEQTLYGYVSRATAAHWGLDAGKTRLLVAVGTADAYGVADRLAETLRGSGARIERLSVNATLEHPHAFQFRANLALLAGMGVVSFLMCAALIVNLVDAIMTTEQRAIGVMKALGGRSRHIARDYLIGMGLLGLVATAVCLPWALRIGRSMAASLAGRMNFELITQGTPWWLVLGVLAIGVLIPVLVAAARVAQAVAMPVREALARVDTAQAHPIADRLGALFAFVPMLPRMAARALVRKPRRSLLTALILSLGLTFFMTTLNLRASLLETVEAVARVHTYDLAVHFRGAYPIEEMRPWIGAFPNVQNAEFWSSDEFELRRDGHAYGDTVGVLGVPPTTAMLQPDLIAGQWLAADRPDEVVVTQKLLADQPQLKLGASFELRLGERAAQVRIGGVVKEFGPGLVYAPAALLERLQQRGARANLMFVRLQESTLSAQRKLAAALEKNTVGSDWQVGDVVTTRLLEAMVRGHLDVIAALMLMISGLAMFIGAAGLASSVSISIVERFREIGVLKAIGTSATAVAGLFVCEAIFLALLGWLVALACAPWLSRGLGASFGSAIVQYPFGYRAWPGAGAMALGLALVIALIASLVPIRSAVRATAYRALRTE